LPAGTVCCDGISLQRASMRQKIAFTSPSIWGMSAYEPHSRGSPGFSHSGAAVSVPGVFRLKSRMRCDAVSQMARYIAVGASLFAIDYGVFYFLSQYLGFTIATAQLVSRSIGAAVRFRSTQSGMRLAIHEASCEDRAQSSRRM